MNLNVTPEREGDLLVEVTLSRRNLEGLLAKLNGHPPDSDCKLERDVREMSLVVRAEENEDHYADRIVGPMHGETEDAVSGGFVLGCPSGQHANTGRCSCQ